MNESRKILRPWSIFRPISLVLLGFALGVLVRRIFSWVDPQDAPPGLNAPAPVNVSDITQSKGGGLNVATNSGSFGIRTISPAARLHLETTGLAATDYGFRMGSNGQFVIDSSGVIGGRLTVLENGNVGIGNNNPDAKLRVNGSVKIVDGTQGSSKVLTSDANGLASWQTPTGKAMILANEAPVIYDATQGTKYHYVWGQSFTSSETSAGLLFPTTVTFYFSRFSARCIANSLNGSLTVSLRKNSVDTGLSPSISAGSTNWSTSTLITPVGFSNNDILSIQTTEAAGSGSWYLTMDSGTMRKSAVTGS